MSGNNGSVLDAPNLSVIDAVTQFVGGTQAIWNTVTIPIPAGLAVYAVDTTVIKMGDGVSLYAALPALFTLNTLSGILEQTSAITAGNYPTTAEMNTAIATAVSDALSASALTTEIQTAVASAVATALSAGYVTTAALTSALAGYVTTPVFSSALGGYATTSDLGAYATTSSVTSALANYVTSTALSTTLGGYTTTAALTAALGPYVTSAALSGTLSSYATVAYVGSVIPPATFTSVNIVTSSRAFGTTYTNSTGKPMLVLMSGSFTGGGALQFFINGVQQVSTDILSDGYFGIVPAGATYKASSSLGDGTTSSWTEVS